MREKPNVDFILRNLMMLEISYQCWETDEISKEC